MLRANPALNPMHQGEYQGDNQEPSEENGDGSEDEESVAHSVDYVPPHPSVDDSLPAIMGSDDPRRMKLTREELMWALDIKDVIEMMPDLDNLADFWYAQYAIICKDNVADAVQRATALQAFREEYKVRETLEDGRRRTGSLILELMPRQWLSFSFSSSDGTYVLVHGLTKCDTTNLTTAKKADDWFASIYYMQTACLPDLESVRKGYICCVECEGWSFRKKQDGKLVQRMFSEFMAHYPFRGQCKHYHTGMIINVIVSACRRILPPEIRETLHVGLKFDGRLDEAFLVPNLDAANQRMLHRLGGALEKRYENEKAFSLSEQV